MSFALLELNLGGQQLRWCLPQGDAAHFARWLAEHTGRLLRLVPVETKVLCLLHPPERAFAAALLTEWRGDHPFTQPLQAG